MPIRRAILETAYTALLAAWLGVILMTAVGAARTFPILKDLAPTLGAYPSYTGEHYRIAAGKVVQTFFWWSDVAQVLCFVASTVILLVLTMSRYLTFTAAAVRWMSAGLLLCLLVYHLLILRPRMAANLSQFWEAAAAGDNARADIFQAAFSADHPRASTALGLIALSLLVALVANAWSMTRDKPQSLTPTSTTNDQKTANHDHQGPDAQTIPVSDEQGNEPGRG
jgi:small-conductance mechanosensitive channel